MNNDWKMELKKNNYECFLRLCECRNVKKDLVTMAKLIYKYNPTQSKEECFCYILEWVGDWNNQFEMTDLTTIEYNKMLSEI